VAAALGLAGIGADATELEVWADPHLDRNTHSIEVDADSAKFTLQIQNVQSESNPGTGKITALSVIACLRGMTCTDENWQLGSLDKPTITISIQQMICLKER
jgi:aspartate dehydrogenase